MFLRSVEEESWRKKCCRKERCREVLKKNVETCWRDVLEKSLVREE